MLRPAAALPFAPPSRKYEQHEVLSRNREEQVSLGCSHLERPK